MDDFTTRRTPATGAPRRRPRLREVFALVLVWSGQEPRRVGELFLLPPAPSGPVLVGRGPARPDDPTERLPLVRQRPGDTRPTAPLGGDGVSRRQLRLQPLDADRLLLESIGRCPVLVNRRRTVQAVLRVGDVVELSGQVLFLVTRRPRVLPPLRWLEDLSGYRFGEPDPHGMVGESPAAWAVRDQIAFIGPRDGHVLIEGPSGAGKELAAHAIHAMSPRRRVPMVARNAATFPEGLIDAELFGNVAGYPNPGMRARAGLVGEADGSTLFLDEIGELPPNLQAHLLRVLDARGEYQRLGEAICRTADFRLVAATNRPRSQLKHDLLARLRFTLRVPPLAERREDIPLILRSLLVHAAEQDPEVGRRFLDTDAGGWQSPRISPELVTLLLRRPLHLNVRELDAVLWRAIAESHHDLLLPPDEWENLPNGADPARPETSGEGTPGSVREPVDPACISRDQLREALLRHNGVQGPVWRELGLKNRYVLRRLIDKHGLRRFVTELAGRAEPSRDQA